MPSKRFRLRRPEGDEWLEVTWNGNVVPVDWDTEEPEKDYTLDCPLSRPLVCEAEDREARLKELKAKLWRP